MRYLNNNILVLYQYFDGFWYLITNWMMILRNYRNLSIALTIMDHKSSTQFLWIKIFWVFVTWLKVEPSNHDSELKEMSELLIRGWGQRGSKEGALPLRRVGAESWLLSSVTWASDFTFELWWGGKRVISFLKWVFPPRIFHSFSLWLALYIGATMVPGI